MRIIRKITAFNQQNKEGISLLFNTFRKECKVNTQLDRKNTGQQRGFFPASVSWDHKPAHRVAPRMPPPPRRNSPFYLEKITSSRQLLIGFDIAFLGEHREQQRQ